MSFLIEFARNTVTMMTGNPSFTTPFVPLAQITSAVNDLEAKFNLALNGGKEQKAVYAACGKSTYCPVAKAGCLC